MSAIKTKLAPDEGLWRVARGPEPFALRDPAPPLRPVDREDRGIGNRFDSAMGDFYVWYCATTLEGCYGETLAPFRPDAKVRQAVGDHDEGLMALGDVPADWRKRRVAVQATFAELPFVDVEAVETRERLTDELSWVLDLVGYDHIDVSAIRSRDRRLTRWISQWVWQARQQHDTPDYAGLRFCSRLNTDWECWAVFSDVHPNETDRRPILVQDSALQRVASLHKLNVF